jgi:hypothetical protein
MADLDINTRIRRANAKMDRALIKKAKSLVRGQVVTLSDRTARLYSYAPGSKFAYIIENSGEVRRVALLALKECR